MKMNKKIAVYMDHFAANILEYTDAAKIVKISCISFYITHILETPRLTE